MTHMDMDRQLSVKFFTNIIVAKDQGGIGIAGITATSDDECFVLFYICLRVDATLRKISILNNYFDILINKYFKVQIERILISILLRNSIRTKSGTTLRCFQCTYMPLL